MEIDVKECVNGHHFDARKYSNCPCCGAPPKEYQPPKAKPVVGKRLNPFSHSKQGNYDVNADASEAGKTPGQMNDQAFGNANRSNMPPQSGYYSPQPDASASQRPVAGGFNRNAAFRCPKCSRPYLGYGSFCTGCGSPLSFPEDKTKATLIDDMLPGSGTSANRDSRVMDGNDSNSYSCIIDNDSVLKPEPDSEDPSDDIIESAFQNEVRTAKERSEGKTRGFFYGLDPSNSSPSQKSDPTVGWLVCMKGHHFGESFPITFGRNSVGRDSSNMIVISRDETVSREKHAWIIYEPKQRIFFIQSGEGSGLTYLNDQPILESRQLMPKDRIQFGQGEYLFVPFCGPDFSWEEQA